VALYHKYVKADYTSYEDFKVNFNVEPPENFNFAYDVVDEMAVNEPDKVAMVWCEPGGEERIFTFADMKRYSDKTASFLKGMGVKRGSPVMIMLKRHYQFWFTIIALHKLGAVAIPATVLLTVKDIVYRIDAADLEMIICTSKDGVPDNIRAAVSESGHDVKMVCTGQEQDMVDFDAELEKASEDFVRPTGEEKTTNDDISLAYFTSGTTGHPKLVRHDFTYPLAHIHTAKFWQQVDEDGLHLTISETGWAKAMWGKLYGQWLSGCAIFAYDLDKFDPNDMLSKIENYRITSLCCPPTMFRYFLRADMDKYDLSSLRHCSVAGEPLSPEIYDEWLQKTGLKLYEGFGQTETTLALGTFKWMEPNPGSMGKPSPGYDIDIINEAGKRCRAGEVGEIIIKANPNGQVGMFREYFKAPELMEKVWKMGFYHTGDMAWRDEHGYFWYVGRADDVIKSSGYRIGPFEVESALLEHAAVLECAITGVPDELRGQIVKATIVLSKGYEPSEELKVELQNHVKKVTAPYKYPRIVEFVKELPKTISGKIRRTELRARDAGKASE
jgi:acetyl-CoA synthetase